MMESETVQQPWFESVGRYRVLFAFLLVFSFIDLRSAWVAASGHGWLRLEIVSPWIMCAVFGLNLHRMINRGELSRKMGGPVLMILGFIVTFAYEAMGKLGNLGH